MSGRRPNHSLPCGAVVRTRAIHCGFCSRAELRVAAFLRLFLAVEKEPGFLVLTALKKFHSKLFSCCEGLFLH